MQAGTAARGNMSGPMADAEMDHDTSEIKHKSMMIFKKGAGDICSKEFLKKAKKTVSRRLREHLFTAFPS